MEFFRRNDVPFALDQVKVLEREVWDEVKIDFLRRGNISLSLFYALLLLGEFLRRVIRRIITVSLLLWMNSN